MTADWPTSRIFHMSQSAAHAAGNAFEPLSLGLISLGLKEMQRHYAAMIIRERMKQARITGMM